MNKDRLSRERRSWNMSRIRGKDTTPEKRVRSLLHRLGYPSRLQARIPIGETLNRTADERRWTRMPNRPRRKVPLLGGVRGGFVRREICTSGALWVLLRRFSSAFIGVHPRLKRN